MQACFASSLSLYTCFHPSKCAPISSQRARRARRARTTPPSRVFPQAIIPSNGAISTTSRRYEGVSWSTVETMCKDIAQQARSDSFDVVLAVTRGGLVPAVMLCEEFELRNILSATVMFYADNGEQFFGMTEPRFLAFPSVDALQGRRVLIVDDVWDSGRTAQAVRNRVKRAKAKDVKVAVLHYKPDKNVFPGVEPDFYSAMTSDWVVYPWERASPKTPHVSFETDGSTIAKESVDGRPPVGN
ncbi:purine phosphoribosyltransferase-like protein [Gracilaria domingensis]|nr:purine phosphoribosyltransferase-like protein [Gracilaria domingensis]